MSGTNAQQRVTKTFPVFDCDAHVNDPDEIWRDYVEPAYRELVRRSYWKDEHQAVLNGRTPVIGGAAYDFPGYNPICLAGPQMSKKIARKLQQIGLTPEQKKYVEHPGAYDPRARLREMDLMGIDQVMIIPTMMVANFPFVENVDGAYAFARAYNNWARDYCAAAPDRLFPAGWLPLQDLQYTCEELERIAKMGFRVALIRSDLMGIDQVMIIPTMMVANFPFVENVDGAYAFARAYNNWARDYCAAAPDRLFPAGWLPLQDLQYTCEELERIAKMGFRVALI